MDGRGQFHPKSDLSSHSPPQLVLFEDSPPSQYYQPLSRSAKSEIHKQAYNSQSHMHVNSQESIFRRFSSPQQFNPYASTTQQLSYFPADPNHLQRSRKNTQDEISCKGARTPRSAGSGFNMNKFLTSYKQKVEGSNSRKSSWNDTTNMGDRQLSSSQLKLTRRIETTDERMVPQLPQISKVTIDFLDNWGDKHFLGAKAIQFFSESGSQIQPTSIIPETPSIYNLINGNIYTKCDQEFWLVPLGKPFSINFVFQRRFTLSMIRIWNYNKSNYTERGIRNIRILGDSMTLFAGQIRKASGKLSSYSQTAQYILFTNSPAIMELISTKDWLSNYSFDHLLQLQLGSPSNEAQPSVIYPLQNMYNCHSLIRVEIVQNYGDSGYTAYQKLRFYNSSGHLIKYKTKTNKDKVMVNPPSPIEFYIVEPSIIEKMVVKNPQNEAAIRRLRVSFDTGLEYTVLLEYTSVDQVFLLNSSIKYDFAALTLDVKDTPLENTVRFGKEMKIILHKNYKGSLVGFNKLEIFDVYNTPMLSSRQIPYYVSENMRYLETAPYSSWRSAQNDNFLVNFEEENPPEIVIKFQSVIVFGAVVMWNYRGNKEEGVQEMQIRIDDKVAYHGYVDQWQQGGRPHVVLLSCRDDVYQYFKSEIRERKGKGIVKYSNEGMLFYSQK